jgi:pyruvate kinase
MATMFLTEHIGVQAIIALTESGGSARYLSRGSSARASTVSTSAA